MSQNLKNGDSDEMEYEYKVSVLVTFYNQEAYVDETMKSIINQNVDFSYQIIIGDDGSNDGTIEKLKKWEQRYPESIELHINDRNGKDIVRGFRASRNRINLLNYVKGKYFIFLDGDDFFSNEMKLQRQVDILDKPENIDCSVCAHDIERLFPDGKSEKMVGGHIPEGKIEKNKYWLEYYFHTDTMLIRSDVIKHIDTKMLENNFNDNLITYSIIQYGKIYYLPECMAVYRQTGDGIWTGEKEAVRAIRNMLIYDIAIKINPNMRKETAVRVNKSWKTLFSMRKSIDIDKFHAFEVEAMEKKFKWTLHWLDYSTLSIYEQVKVLLEYLYVIRVNLWREQEIKLYRIYKKLKDRVIK